MYKIGDRFNGVDEHRNGFTIIGIRNEPMYDHPILTVRCYDGIICNMIYPTNIDEWLVYGTIYKIDTIDIRKHIKKLEIQ
jgi:hypothetical protein